MKKHIVSGLIFIFLLLTGSFSAFGQEKSEKDDKAFNASEFILNHISDSHEWHLLTTGKGKHVSLYLPVILISKEQGLDVFSSKRLAHGQIYKGYRLVEEGDLAGKIVFANDDGTIKDEGSMPLDLSITKTVLGMLFAAIIGLLLFVSLAKSYKKTGLQCPKGLHNCLEFLVVFVRDDVAIPNLGEKHYEKFMPYLLSVFFFILLNNVFGLIPTPPPFGANVTGNIALTMVLALFTFFITQFSGNKTYWKHIFKPAGIPFWLLPIMIPVEIIGMFSKPFALMVRLFANITAGHIIVMSLICLIFIFDSLAVAPLSMAFVIFMDCIELLVAFLQAYIFTLLSALFIGLAMPEEHE